MYGVIAYNRDNVVAGTGRPYSVNNPNRWKAGNTTLAPTGLGLLASGNYMADLNAFYCPTGSAYDANTPGLGPPAGWGGAPFGVAGSYSSDFLTMEVMCGNIGSFFVNTAPSNLKLLGGTDAQYLTHGDLTSTVAFCDVYNGWGGFSAGGLIPWNCVFSGGQPATQWTQGAAPGADTAYDGCAGSIVIGCSYAYRNQSYTDAGEHIMSRMWSCGADAERLGANDVFPTLYIPGAGAADPTGAIGWYNRMPSPRFVQMHSLCPERKTTKTLGSLSIASDRFDTHICGPQFFNNWWGWNFPTSIPGAGMYGHKVGYNVLFGDGHVAWYPDPQQWWIWEFNRITSSGDRPMGNDSNQGDGSVWRNENGGWGGSGYGYGTGIFTIFDDWANGEAVPGFYMGGNPTSGL